MRKKVYILISALAVFVYSFIGYVNKEPITISAASTAIVGVYKNNKKVYKANSNGTATTTEISLDTVTRLIIGPDVKSLGANAFRNKPKLKVLDLRYADELRKYDANTFSGTTKISRIFVTSGKKRIWPETKIQSDNTSKEVHFLETDGTYLSLVGIARGIYGFLAQPKYGGYKLVLNKRKRQIQYIYSYLQ